MNHCRICFKDVDEGVSIFQYFFRKDCICGNCRQRFVENHRVFHYCGLKIRALYLYDDFLENLLFQYKEGRDVALAPIFFKQRQKEIEDIFRHKQCVIMPSSSLKIEQRGFHPILKMFEGIDVKIQDPFRKNKNYKQSQQSASQRSQIHQIIELEEEIKGEFIFFDDVITTGNTLMAAAHLVRKNNEEIEVFALSVHPRFVELCDEEEL